MEHRQRQLIAALILVLSVFIVGYLIFRTPSESRIATPTPTMVISSSLTSVRPASSPGSDNKKSAEVRSAYQQFSPEDEDERDNDPSRAIEAMPEWMQRIASKPENQDCPETAVRIVEVTNASELTQALDAAEPGDRISLATGTYTGNFVLASSGEAGKRIWICGPRDAVIDSGGPKEGYGLQITGSYVGVWGLTVSNAQKGIMIDGGDFVQIDFVEVLSIGDEGIHFRGNATDGVVQDSLVHHTGLRRDKFGEGIYVGSAVSNWSKITDGEPDMSDRVTILRNRIWDTTAESIDIKEGTTGGRIEFNLFDGGSLTGADSWVDVKGNGYVVSGNAGSMSPEDGFQTHHINDLNWGRDNQFFSNTAHVSGPGYGFYIHDAQTTSNLVSCTNLVTRADAGFANIPCSEAS